MITLRALRPEDLPAVAELAHAAGALFVVVADPVSLGVLEAPGKLGADIVVGEGQARGNAMNFGGPGVGFMAVTTKLMRRIPGRLVGERRRTRSQPGSAGVTA